MLKSLGGGDRAARLIGVIALTFALTGGAYATVASTSAKKYKITSTKQIKPSVLKALQGADGKDGAAGAPGAAGPAGPAGAKGDAGPAGAKGDAGATGAKGADGAAGTGVTVADEETGTGNCGGNGGVKVTAAGGTEYACNGADGQTGFTDFLPTNKTETGAWQVVSDPDSVGVGAADTLSFNIPLGAALPDSKVVFDNGVGPAEDATNCPGSVAAPQAAQGYLCVYQEGQISAANTLKDPIVLDIGSLSPGAGTAGALLLFQTIEHPTNGNGDPVPGMSLGTWAVTGA